MEQVVEVGLAANIDLLDSCRNFGCCCHRFTGVPELKEKLVNLIAWMENS